MSETKSKKEKNRFKSTLNLPKTAFPMKASLVQNEPASLKRWQKNRLYDRVQQERIDEAADRFVFHDGPPYANGSIHLGHMLNKVLKDFVVRSQLMAGKACPYVPGWDCHGLPIEHKVMTELAEKGKLAKLAELAPESRAMAIRKACKDYANKHVKHQRTQMERLLTLADYDNPYLTMLPEYEGAVLEVFAGLVENGLVYRQLKPVHWSVENETALADAELEYHDRFDPSIYVDFESRDPDAVYDAFGVDADTREEKKLGAAPTFMIWTTTPWTLASNLAVAVQPKATYALVRLDGNVCVLAEALVEKVASIGKVEEPEIIATCEGTALAGLRYKHPYRGEDAPNLADLPAAATRGASADKIYSVMAADYVTLEDGTGLVHTAPGHGVEDYQTGLREGLPIYCPVQGDGTYDTTTPDWLQGVKVWDANPLVIKRLVDSGHMYHHFEFEHSYPHDWRSKTPTIFRATEQWFVSVDENFNHKTDPQGALVCTSLRERALIATGLDHNNPITDQQRAEVEGMKTMRDEVMQKMGEAGSKQREEYFDSMADELEEHVPTMLDAASWFAKQQVNFIPEWGRNRMRGMLETRPDWCISRQRAWGLPIPAFYTEDGVTILTTASVRAIAQAFREDGSDSWFQKTPADLLRFWDSSADPEWEGDAPNLDTLTKSTDIFDVWFESGSSWNAVMRERSGGADKPLDAGRDQGVDYPIELYLEGSDQHRGWFQLSILPGLGTTGQSPFKSVLTHGFMVDKDGKKMSKSLGNALNVDELMKDFGADVCRWWVASISYENDIKVDLSFFQNAGEAYRKVRNTVRFLLSVIDDYDPDQHAPAGNPAPETLDAWVLSELDRVQGEVRKGYETYHFQKASVALYNFCNDTLSSVYLAAVKDRLYCDAKDEPRRRQTQAAIFRIADALCRLLAPIMPHTADEAYAALHGVNPKESDETVHTLSYLDPTGVEAHEGWAKVMEARDAALRTLEDFRSQSDLDNPLDASVTLPDPANVLMHFDHVDLADLLGVSRAVADPAIGDVAIEDLRHFPRCERSWKRDETVKEVSWTDADGETVQVPLSARDAKAVGAA